jgi:uncharacterized Fe-S cluster protein YjdI
MEQFTLIQLHNITEDIAEASCCVRSNMFIFPISDTKYYKPDQLSEKDQIKVVRQTR